MPDEEIGGRVGADPGINNVGFIRNVANIIQDIDQDHLVDFVAGVVAVDGHDMHLILGEVADLVGETVFDVGDKESPIKVMRRRPGVRVGG